MKKAYHLIFFLFLFSDLFGQTFEGCIRYKMSCVTNMKDVSTDQICMGIPAYLDYYIKGGNYKFIANDSSLLNWMVYNNDENRTYSKFASSDTVFWKDPNIDTDSIRTFKINKKVIEILGYKCDEIIFTCQHSIHKFYFNSDISVDKSLFINHRDANLYDFFSLSNSLPLKEVLESEYSILEYTAIDIKPMKLEKKIFELPDGFKIEKSPF